MKKIIFVLLVFAVVTGSAFADFDIMSFPPPVQAGNIMVDAGLGLRALGLSGHNMSIPPLFVQVEYALPAEVGLPISVGAGITFGQWKWELLGFGYKVTYVTPHARANWHWGLDNPSWLDFYTGISLGWDIASVKWTDSILGSYSGGGTAASGFFFAFQVGAHFYFKENVGAMVETGYPYWLKAGIALKF